jgi:Predicted membrane protein (DUF2306)
MKRSIWIIVIILAVIGIAAVIRRILILENVIGSFAPPNAKGFDSGFGKHPLLTLVHIIPGILFMVLGPLQFVTKIKEKNKYLYRWIVRIYFTAAYIIGISALAMSYTVSIGGANETAATTLFALLFLFSLTKALNHLSHRRMMVYREWMIRGFAIGLAIATVRPIVGMFFAFSKLSPHEFFGIAFWLGFTIHLIAAESWINYTRSKMNKRAIEGSIE